MSEPVDSVTRPGVYGRLLKTVAPPCLVVFIVLIAGFEWQLHRDSVQSARERIEAMAGTAALTLAEPLLADDMDRIRVHALALATDPDLGSLSLVDADGAVRYTVQPRPDAQPLATVPLTYRLEGTHREVGTLTVGFSPQRLDAVAIDRVMHAGVLLGALIATVWVATRVAYRRVLGTRLDSLGRAIEDYERTGAHAPLDNGSLDELGDVMSAYNRMQTRAEAYREELDDLNQALEREVLIRTNELADELSEHARTGDLLRRERQYLEVTLESVTDGIITLGEDGVVRYANPAAQRITGYETVDGARLDDLLRVAPVDGQPPPPEMATLFEQVTEDSERPWEAWLTARDGAERYIEMRAAPLKTGEARIGLAVFVRDVTEARNLAARLSHQASHDPLTNLPNRREFERQLRVLHDEACRGEATHALCFVDLDRFKIINDTAGHAAGDQLLRQLSLRLSRLLRPGDLAARLGGDEFAVLLRRCDTHDARHIGESLRASVEDFRFAWQGQTFHVGVSVGIAGITGDAETPDELLRRADVACYLAKESGRNQVHVHDDEASVIELRRSEMRWVHEVERALEEDRFEVMFQRIEPAVDEGQDRWAEMLVRVRTRDGTLHGAGAFLPAVERYGLATQLDRWLVERCMRWLESGESAAVGVNHCSINLSGMTLANEAFRDFVTARLDDSPLAPGQVCFEITETAAISNLLEARALIDALRERGCSISLDDFGSGLSSFGYLRELPVDHLKIDGSFVRAIDTDTVDRELVRSINAIGHIMNLTTVAEYVESDAVLDILRDIGVDYVQGYAIHRPSTAIAAAPVAEVIGS